MKEVDHNRPDPCQTKGCSNRTWNRSGFCEKCRMKTCESCQRSFTCNGSNMHRTICSICTATKKAGKK